MVGVAGLTEHAGLSRETIRRRLAEDDLKPWRRDMWCIPHVDGSYVARMEDVLDLYAEATAAVLVNHYAKRWTIEPSFRDTKDLRFGMGLSSTRIGEPMRRDRLLLVSAFAMALLTLLGAVGESLGMDRLLKSNTSKTRTHSLFRQGCMLY